MITSNRDVGTTLHTTPEVKEALREEATRQRRSMSAVIFQALVDYLRNLGHDVSDRVEKRADNS